jgi:hypothetical protein
VIALTGIVQPLEAHVTPMNAIILKKMLQHKPEEASDVKQKV